MGLIALLGLLLVAGCAPSDPPADTVSTEGVRGEALQGTVRIVGSAPMNIQVVLQPEQGRSIRLAGPLLPELERLGGVVVSVEGPVSPAPDPLADRQIEVTSYEIISVDGRPVVMGEIVSVSGNTARLRTSAGEEVVLSAVPAEFKVGQKVWVQGPGSIIVQTYGTIRP